MDSVFFNLNNKRKRPVRSVVKPDMPPIEYKQIEPLISNPVTNDYIEKIKKDVQDKKNKTSQLVKRRSSDVIHDNVDILPTIVEDDDIKNRLLEIDKRVQGLFTAPLPRRVSSMVNNRQTSDRPLLRRTVSRTISRQPVTNPPEKYKPIKRKDSPMEPVNKTVRKTRSQMFNGAIHNRLKK